MLLSIVVSAYQVEDYIEKCLQSILEAELFDYEIILVVRDGESECNKKCYDFQKTHSNTKVVVQKGEGLSNARNCGLENAYGEYIFFFDGDDYVVPEKLLEFEKKLLGLKKYQPDVIVNDFYMVDEGGRIVHTRHQIENTDEEILDSSYTKQYIQSRKAIWNIWRYTYSKKYLVENDRSFMENYLCEDVDFTVRTFLTADKILYYHNPFYCYCGNREKSLFNCRTAKYSIDLLDIVEKLFLELKEKEYLFKHQIQKKIVGEMILSMVAVCEMSHEEAEIAMEKYQEKLYLLKKSECFIGNVVYSLLRVIGVKKFADILSAIKRIRRKLLYKL